MNDFEKKLLADGNENKSTIVPVSTFQQPVIATSVPVSAFTDGDIERGNTNHKGSGISNEEKRNFKCWCCGGTGHLRRNCPRARNEENTVSSSEQEN
ncbi:hypothetical protein TNCV_411951 [Trichonephila clavipes]|uniref:CCHC-type domain-containing protein n=1 Tax=Trichonephila clavipes TaxID=2585209 RepID=A0A8X6S842_TRICX|nr:hypothetical protein TNCV_411951 [Trichonephila clavipes]